MNTTRRLRNIWYNSPVSLHIQNILGQATFILISSSLYIALNNGSLVLLSFLMQRFEPDIVLIGAAILLTFTGYNFNRLNDTREDIINSPERSTFFKETRQYWMRVLTFSLLASLGLGMLKGSTAVLILVFPIVIVTLYSIKLPLVPRLKDIPGVKNVSIATSWAVMGSFLPVSSSSLTSPATLFIFFFVFVRVFVGSVLFDVRDVKGDSEAGVRTLPIIFGLRQMKKLLTFFNFLLVPWLLMAWYFTYFYQFLILLAFNTAFGFWCIRTFCKPKHPKWTWLDILVDGEWIHLALFFTFQVMMAP